jgi:hypothetical protein
LSNIDPNSLEACLRLIPASDLASGRLRLDPGCAAGLVTTESIMLFLEARSVSPETIDDGGVTELARLAEEEPEKMQTVLVCAAMAPEPGRDGGFEMIESIQTLVDKVRDREAKLRQRQRGEESSREKGRPGRAAAASPEPEMHVDFYNQSSFVVVNLNDPLGRCVEPTPGRDGLDIFGKVIPTTPGKPSSDHFDKSIRIDDEGRAFAGLAGRFITDRAGIRVERTLEIDGPVSFVTGNIDFPGEVNISAGVKDRFVVKAGSHVSVRELVEACTIECLGDLHLVAGVAGREMAEFSVGGNLSARYLEACTGTVAGDTEISGEITNCGLVLEGNLTSPSCTVRGGELSVAGRIDIATLGSENGTHTMVHAASLHGLDRLLDRVMQVGPQLINALDRVNTRIESSRALETVDDHTAGVLETLENQRNEKGTLLNKLATGLERMLELTAKKTEVHFMVRKVIHPGSVITFKGWRAEFEQKVRGPILFTVNKAGHPMATAPGESKPGPLDRFARVIEDTSTISVEIAQARARELRQRTQADQASKAA